MRTAHLAGAAQKCIREAVFLCFERIAGPYTCENSMYTTGPYRFLRDNKTTSSDFPQVLTSQLCMMTPPRLAYRNFTFEATITKSSQRTGLIRESLQVSYRILTEKLVIRFHSLGGA